MRVYYSKMQKVNIEVDQYFTKIHYFETKIIHFYIKIIFGLKHNQF